MRREELAVTYLYIKEGIVRRVVVSLKQLPDALLGL
jgi:hypothetical protein